MATEMKEWIAESNKKYGGIPVKEMSHLHFFRDPPRAAFIDQDFFFSPADGFIVNQGVTKHGDIINVKGRDFTLQECLGDPHFEGEALVIGIFMSFRDVHINRMPTDGTLSYKPIDPLKTHNIPMLAEEQDILRHHSVNKGDMEFLFQNQRMKNKVYVPLMKYTYYMVQIADSDVKVVMPFNTGQNETMFQGERYSLVRWGSEVMLILPLDKRYEFTALHKLNWHVEAGQDALVHVAKKNERAIRVR